MGAVSPLRDWLRKTFAGKTERRLAMVILFTTMVPLVVALYLATSMFRQASAIWFNPEIGEQLDRGVDVYKDYVKAIKDDLKHQTVAIAADPVLREAAKKHNIETLESEIDAVFPHFPELVALAVEDSAGQTLSRRDRGHPVDAATEMSLEVRRALSDDADAPMLVASFAVSRRRLDELESAGVVVARYHQLEASRADLYQGYLRVFALLLGITAAMTIVLGAALARGLTKRINRLGAAINVVAQGDLSVRVPVTGTDELTDLARTFNRMIAEMAQSRARIEFLQRVGAWQDMAQRLAHEIKNPLTPIQLAVQECHQQIRRRRPEVSPASRCDARDRRGRGGHAAPPRRQLLELRAAPARRADRGEPLGFSARLRDASRSSRGPIARRRLRRQRADPRAERGDPLGGPERGIMVALDRQMLRRVLVNLVRNAVQAIRDAQKRKSTPGSSPDVTSAAVLGHVTVSAEREGDGARIVVEDDGPGIADSVRGRIFDPYFTTKADGTGLGLAIVKKVVVEHGGEIEATASRRLGGARFVLRLPGLKILSIAAAAKEARERAKKQGVETVDEPS